MKGEREMKTGGVVYCDRCKGSVTGDKGAILGPEVICSDCQRKIIVSEMHALLQKRTNKPVRADRTERALGALGCSTLILAGVAVVLLCSDGGVDAGWYAVLTLVCGIVGAVWFFTAQMTLRYLRRIVNAVEKSSNRRERAS